MSRIGKLPITIPNDVTVDISGNQLKVKGKRGEMEYQFSSEVSLHKDNNLITIKPKQEKDRHCRAIWGLSRTLAFNMVTGVSQGFSKKLEITGTGYKASVDSDGILFIALGFSHDIAYVPPLGIEIKCEKPTLITISGCDKQMVGQVAAEIRSHRKPEPYKGKGVKYSGEIIRRKESKKK